MNDDQGSKGAIDQSYRSNLLALISHELNTPLTGIVNAISVLENEDLQNPEFFKMLKRNTDRLRTTVDSLLELASADAGALRVHLSESSLENLLQLQEDRLKDYLTANKFSIQTVIEDQLPNVCIDSVRLGRAYSALVEHAILFGDKSAKSSVGENLVRVELSLVPMDTVRDLITVDGIEEQTAMFLDIQVSTTIPTMGEVDSFEDLFEPFSPWRDVYTRSNDGIGVELALAREIMIAHKGYIGVGPAQRPDEGWVFRLGVPILSREDELREVIDNRIHSGLGRLSKTSIVLIRPTDKSITEMGELRPIEEAIASLLYRSSDSVFSIPSLGEITIVMDDCNLNGADRLAERLTAELKDIMPSLEFVFGAATGPDHGTTAEELLAYVRRHWHNFK